MKPSYNIPMMLRVVLLDILL